jgi:hypothetical protein
MPKSDFDDAVFRQPPRQTPDKAKRKPSFVNGALPKDQEGVSFCINIKGDHTDNEGVAACKRVTNGSVVTHFVKFAVDGPDRGHMLNPYSIYFREGDDTRIEARRGSMRYEFKRVTEQAFNLYVKFLSTKIGAYRLDAERMVLNG